MLLRPLVFLSPFCRSSELLLSLLSGPRKCPWRVLGLVCLCWMVRLVVTRGFMCFGIGLGFFEDILLTTRWMSLGCIAFLVSLLLVVLVMVLRTFRPGLPMLHQLAGPYQHFKAAIWDAWRAKVSFDLCRRQGFRGGPLLDIAGSLQLLHAPHVRERDKALLRSIMVGGVWNGLSCQGRTRSMSLLRWV